MEGFSVPVLLIVYKRADTAARVLDSIAVVRPQRLFISSNAPNPLKEDDFEKVAKVRSLIEEKITWPCKVEKLYRTEHVGAGVSIASAVTWFFENVEEGIILEDDTLPDLSFFGFCKNLLEKYRDNPQIKIIGGSNYANREIECKSSYYFTAFPHIWGWASWRRTWKEYDFKLESIDESEVYPLLKKYFTKKEVIKSWVNNFKMIKEGKISTWDFQLCFSVFKKGGFNIVSSNNLVSNIGFGIDATHTLNTDDELAGAPLTEITTMIHPEKIEIDKVQDEYTEMKVSKAGKVAVTVKLKRLIGSITKKIIRM